MRGEQSPASSILDKMPTAVASEPIPLSIDADQVIRVGGTRVTLETVVDAFNAGATPEEIVQDFPTLRLDDTYAVITYYLRHRDEVDEYRRRRQTEADEIRSKIEKSSPQTGLRERLIARLDR